MAEERRELTRAGCGDSSSRQRAHSAEDELTLRKLFSDESEAFRYPSAPSPGRQVVVRLRVEADLDVWASVLLGAQPSRVTMRQTHADGLFSWYEASFTCGIEPVSYRFLVEAKGVECALVYQRDGAHWADEPLCDEYDFRVVPGFDTPAWAQGAVQYQIFTDRFANGEPGNDVVDREYAYGDAQVKKITQWDATPTDDDYRCFYGGDLQGVASKLDYLQSLGVEVVYLNPIFVAPSSHKYDTQDYGHVDPHFAVISDDLDQPLPEGDFSNRHALQYVRRTTSPQNLEQSDALFAEICREIHKRGMRIILDGVFNHCGSFCAWLDREGIYQGQSGREPGAFHASDSPYRPYFHFKDASTTNYEAWWDFPTLPKLNYEGSPELCDQIIRLAQHWAMPPYSIDGWRLDVAADVGQSESFNHGFWRRFRTELKRVNPDLVIVAEHYGNPAPWLQGDQWDTVMNYDAFMDPLTYFLTGMEKHSDRKDDSLYQNGEAFCLAMRESMGHFGWASLLCAMNELSNHDHSRFLTRTNREVGRTNTAGAVAAGEGVDMRVMREAVVVQMTWPGAPTIYYGDEAGQVGWTDPDCRRTYPWGCEDQGLIELHRSLADLRRRHASLRKGSFVMLGGGEGWIAFGRFLDDDRVVTICNNADDEQVIDVRVRELGVEDKRAMQVLFQTTADGFVAAGRKKASKAKAGGCRVAGSVKHGMLTIVVPARTAVILTEKPRKD